MPELNLKIPRPLYFQENSIFRVYYGNTRIGNVDPYWQNVTCYIHSTKTDSANGGFFNTVLPSSTNLSYNVYNQDLRFGFDGYVAVGRLENFDDYDTLTLDFWAYFPNTDTEYALFTSSTFCAIFYLSSDPNTTPSTLTILSKEDPPVTTVFNLSSVHSPPIATYKHFYIVRKKYSTNAYTYFTLYLDGTFVETITGDFAPLTESTTRFVLGRFSKNSTTYYPKYFRFKKFRVTHGIERFLTNFNPITNEHRDPITLDTLNPLLYLDSTNESSVLLSTTNVYQWTDLSGNNNHAIQNTDTDRRPTYETDLETNKKIIKFSADSLKAPCLITDNTFEIFILCRLHVGSEYTNLLGAAHDGGILSLKQLENDNDWNNPASWSLLSQDNTESLATHYYATQGSSVGSGLTEGEPVLINIIVDTTNPIFRINASSDTIYYKPIQNLNTTDGLTIGKKYVSSAHTTPEVYGSFSVSQIMIFTRVLSDIERTQTEGWLAWKAGLPRILPSNHLCKHIPPYF